MVRTVKSHNEEEEEEEEEDEHVFASHDSSQKVKAERRSGDRKANASRSKHSETEQRRRSKINERFQILRDLIPENDQKRDKASFLLEVIQYIQFLQEKVEIYEGTYQGWSPEPSKLIPWRSKSGPVESFIEQSPVISNGCSQEDNIVVTPTLLTNAQHSVESNLSGTAVYKLTDHPHGSADQVIPLDMPLQPNMFEGMSAQPPQGSIPDVEQLASQSRSSYLAGKWSTDCAIPNLTPTEQEDLRSETGEASVSNAYSQGLLNKLTRALQSSGVDLTQASLSVQLDIGKRRNTGTSAATYSTKDNQNQPGVQPMAQYATCADNYDHGNKRLRT